MSVTGLGHDSLFVGLPVSLHTYVRDEGSIESIIKAEDYNNLD